MKPESEQSGFDRLAFSASYPEFRVLGLLVLDPPPSFIGPEFLGVVSSALNKQEEVSIGH